MFAPSGIATAAESVDLTLRHVSHRFPEELARALLPHACTLEGFTWHDTQFAARERRLDKVLRVRAAPRDEGFSGLRLRVEPVYQRTVQELADRRSPLWMILAPHALVVERTAEIFVEPAWRSGASRHRSTP